MASRAHAMDYVEPAVQDLFPALFQPLQIGSMTVRNRIFVSGHQSGLVDNGLIGDRYVSYFRERARGGASLLITGATPIHENVKSAGYVNNWTDAVIPGYRQLADAVHAEGAKMLAQLAHAGPHHPYKYGAPPAWAPSPKVAELTRNVPHEMDVDEIHELVDSFAKGAVRAKEGGLDGVELLFAFGWLVALFLSPYTNERTDEYGGSLDNRMRLAIEIIDAVRAAVGSDFVVGIRMPADELVEGGIDIRQAQEIARRFDETGKIDYLNVIAGTNVERMSRMRHWPPSPAGHGIWAHLSDGIKEVVNVPVFCVGRVTDVRMAEQIVADGMADMVAMTRAHIADPHLVRKAAAGQLDEIRPCVGANFCIDNAMHGGVVACIHNPTVGREAEWMELHPVASTKNVLVVGGGPAGMEAARVAALRGHHVTLIEKQTQLGGNVRVWTQAPTRSELSAIADHLSQSVYRAGVDVKLEFEATADSIAELAPDTIIVATGATATTRNLPGMDEPQAPPLFTLPQLYAGEISIAPSSTVMVYDETGAQRAGHAAITLAKMGAQVKLVTPLLHPAESEGVTNLISLYELLFQHQIELVPHTRVVGVGPKTAITQNAYTYERSAIEDIDLIIWIEPLHAQDHLYRQIKKVHPEVYCIGDSLAPRTTATAIFEGSEVARRI